MFLSYLGIALKPRVYQPYKPAWKRQALRSAVLRAGSVLTIIWETKIKTPKLILQKPIYTLQLHGLLLVLLYS